MNEGMQDGYAGCFGNLATRVLGKCSENEVVGTSSAKTYRGKRGLTALNLMSTQEDNVTRADVISENVLP